MKKFYLLLLIISSTLSGMTQSNCVTITGNTTSGKFIQLNLDSRGAFNSDYSQTEIVSAAWTCNAQGDPICNFRGLFRYDVSEIPANAVISSARLFLYAKTNALNGNFGNPTFGSANTSLLQRVTAPWGTTTTGWSNQPPTTTQSQKILPQSSSTVQNYEVDVTDFVQGWVANSSTNHGMLLRLQSEVYYNSMIFNSGTAPDGLKPKLEICYTVATACNGITFVPGNGSIAVSGLTAPVVLLQLSNSSWATVFSQVYTNSPGTVTIPGLAAGQYYARAYLFNADWSPICDKDAYVNVSAGTGLPVVSVSADMNVNENALKATVQVCLSQPSNQLVSVNFTTTGGTATSGVDFTPRTGSLTFDIGETCKSLEIVISDDGLSEQTETFNFVISNPVNATIGDGTTVISIIDNDQIGSPCNDMSIVPGAGNIAINNLHAPIAMVQVSNSSWATIFSQIYNNINGNITIPGLSAGQYEVRVNLFNADWSPICEKIQYVTVTAVDVCPPGAICIQNTCPSGTVNLNTAYSIPNLPAGTVVSWHTGTPATNANKLTPAQAAAVSVSGLYYASINITASNCYSATILVGVTIRNCPGAQGISNPVTKIAEETRANKITIAPNPFADGLRVSVDATVEEKVMVSVLDMFGKQLLTKSVQLTPGKNQINFDGLEKFAAGTYLVRVAFKDKSSVYRVVRQAR